MIYFDTDVLVHFVINQDEMKHSVAKKMVIEAVQNAQFSLSTLSLQEWLFVMAKLSVSTEIIERNYTVFKRFATLSIDMETFDRGHDLASQVGFRHINDCLHTAIAEKHCLELLTYNQNDFKKIEKLSSLVVTIL
ncbi:MAG: PIN domain-containing protein [Sulfuricurvum sp.]|jgi:predicted nucleic acid-binding protein|uniref:type II toxin-antitoxin system VapC family toxin n=1 Tax=Sulfuricurvum sp. TaxID=2025608 RepID=UPI0025E49553|nr:PIN domain-containing protein [Sulfuricurvum sp.]MCK9371683.1 PIN domain-containing protein [Sulfuricurvum sp.]